MTEDAADAADAPPERKERADQHAPSPLLISSPHNHQAERRSLLSRAPTEPEGPGMTSRSFAASFPAAAAAAAEAAAEAAAPGCVGEVCVPAARRMVIEAGGAEEDEEAAEAASA